MNNSLSEIMLRANTALFAQKVSKTLDDFFGTTYQILANSLFKGFYKSTGSLTAFMHFSGAVQGDFIVTTEEAIAEKFVKKCLDLQDDDRETLRKGIADYFTEVLNISSGQTIPELEKKYGPMVLLPPGIVFGELRLAEVVSGNVDISNESSVIRCTLSLNLASLTLNK